MQQIREIGTQAQTFRTSSLYSCSIVASDNQGQRIALDKRASWICCDRAPGPSMLDRSFLAAAYPPVSLCIFTRETIENKSSAEARAYALALHFIMQHEDNTTI